LEVQSAESPVWHGLEPRLLAQVSESHVVVVENPVARLWESGAESVCNRWVFAAHWQGFGGAAAMEGGLIDSVFAMTILKRFLLSVIEIYEE
jgi:hypothetical protein